MNVSEEVLRLNKKECYVSSDGLSVQVKIVDFNDKLFGEKRYLVIPVMGFGQKWVKEESILSPADAKLIAKIK